MTNIRGISPAFYPPVAAGYSKLGLSEESGAGGLMVPSFRSSVGPLAIHQRSPVAYPNLPPALPPGQTDVDALLQQIHASSRLQIFSSSRNGRTAPAASTTDTTEDESASQTERATTHTQPSARCRDRHPSEICGEDEVIECFRTGELLDPNEVPVMPMKEGGMPSRAAPGQPERLIVWQLPQAFLLFVQPSPGRRRKQRRLKENSQSAGGVSDPDVDVD